MASHVCRWFSRGGSGASYYMFNGGNDYALTAGDHDATKVRGARFARGPPRALSLTRTTYAPLRRCTAQYATHAAVEPVLQRPNEPKYSHLAALHAVLRAHTAVLSAEDPPAAPQLLPGGCEARVYANATLELAFVFNPHKHSAATCMFDGRSVNVTLQPQAHALLSQPRGAAHRAPPLDHPLQQRGLRGRRAVRRKSQRDRPSRARRGELVVVPFPRASGGGPRRARGGDGRESGRYGRAQREDE